MSQIPGAPQDPTPPPGPPGYGPPQVGPPPGYGSQPGYGQQPYGQPSGGYSGGAVPGAEMAPAQQRLWGCLAHLSGLVAALLTLPSAGLLYAGALGPLVIFLVLKDRGVFVRRQAAEALNFQILFSAIYLVGSLLTVLTLGFGGFLAVPVLVALGIVFLVFQVIAAVRANQGVDYRYPFTWRLVK